MRLAYLTHSLDSCWNHGNAHFLRGVLSDLAARGHDVRVFEPAESWSRANLVADHGEEAATAWRSIYPRLSTTRYDTADPAAMTDGADVVIVHEWTPHDTVAAIGRLRRTGGRFLLLFHDTHHRAVSDPASMRAYDLSGYDGVLAFGAALAETYRGWGHRVFVWHEAADTAVFHPPAAHGPRSGAVWVGNWGDGERTAELEAFLFAPMRQAGMALDVYGVRYPPEALGLLDRYGARYHGWLANPAAPGVFARHAMTVHVPRGPYTRMLPGIPTIRVFEALACGIPLVCAPWDDAEGLFNPGADYLVARNGAEMQRHIETLRDDPARAAALAAHGLATIRARHTCTHRVDELLGIITHLRSPSPASGRGFQIS